MKKQSGNALWFILIAIGLLGLLTVSMTRGGSNSNETGSFEQNQIQASEILNNAKSIENAVQTLLARGCSENQISFENSTVTGYANANAPTDNSCHVFDIAGTGMTYESPKERWLDSSESAKTEYGDFLFTSANEVINLQRAGKSDLLLMINWVSDSICSAINRAVFSNATITEDPSDFDQTKFIGAFDTIADTIDLSSAAIHDGVQSACFTSQTSGGNHFYHAVHPR